MYSLFEVLMKEPLRLLHRSCFCKRIHNQVITNRVRSQDGRTFHIYRFFFYEHVFNHKTVRDALSDTAAYVLSVGLKQYHECFFNRYPVT